MCISKKMSIIQTHQFSVTYAKGMKGRWEETKAQFMTKLSNHLKEQQKKTPNNLTDVRINATETWYREMVELFTVNNTQISIENQVGRYVACNMRTHLNESVTDETIVQASARWTKCTKGTRGSKGSKGCMETSEIIRNMKYFQIDYRYRT